MSNEDGKMDNIDSLIRRSESQSLTTQDTSKSTPMSAVPANIEKIRTDKLDFLGRFKAGRIERKAALATLQTMHEGQLEATKHAIKRAVEADHHRVDIIVQRYMSELTDEYLRDMKEMEFGNFTARSELMINLEKETARLLTEAESQQVPSRIKEMTVDGIFKKYKEFFEKLMAEEIKLS